MSRGQWWSPVEGWGWGAGRVGRTQELCPREADGRSGVERAGSPCCSPSPVTMWLVHGYSLFLCLVRTCCLLVMHEPYELMGAVLTATAIDILGEQPGEGDFLPIFWLGELLFTLQNPDLCHPFYEIQLFVSKHASASGPLCFLSPLSPRLPPWLRPGRVFLFRHYIK